MKDIIALRNKLERLAQEISQTACELEAITIDSSDEDQSAYGNVIDLCSDCEHGLYRVKRIANDKRQSAWRKPVSAQRMTAFIIAEIEKSDKEHNTMKISKIIPGGADAAARRRAAGKCELCGTEFRLSAHHIVPRDEGGLDDVDNLIILCKPCHDEIEDQDYRTRADILRHDRTNRRIERTPDEKRTTAEKAAATRAANIVAQRSETQELEEWAQQWPGFWKYVPSLPADAPEVHRPEKTWHVIVYGAGRHATHV